MKLEGTIYCELDDCEVHRRLGLTRFDTRGALDNLPPGWLRVSTWNERERTDDVFCSLDCLLKWAAKFPPAERIDFDDLAEGTEG